MGNLKFIRGVMNIGVIGCGYWGPNLIRNFSALDDCNVVAVADNRQNRLDFISKQFPAIKKLTTNANDILQATDIDAIVIATPVSTHFQLGMEALTNGKHLLIEKPFTATVVQSKQLIEEATKRNLNVLIKPTIIN